MNESIWLDGPRYPCLLYHEYAYHLHIEMPANLFALNILLYDHPSATSVAGQG